MGGPTDHGREQMQLAKDALEAAGYDRIQAVVDDLVKRYKESAASGWPIVELSQTNRIDAYHGAITIEVEEYRQGLCYVLSLKWASKDCHRRPMQLNPQKVEMPVANCLPPEPVANYYWYPWSFLD